MDNEQFVELVQQGNKAAHLLGQVSGQLHTIMQLNEGEIKTALEVLFKHVIHIVEAIYYKKPEVEK